MQDPFASLARSPSEREEKVLRCTRKDDILHCSGGMPLYSAYWDSAEKWVKPNIRRETAPARLMFDSFFLLRGQ